MLEKHIFRFELENIPPGLEYLPELKNVHKPRRIDGIKALQEELKTADEILTRHFSVHVVKVDFEERIQEGYEEYTRDVMQQYGSGIFVKPTILHPLDVLSRLSQSSASTKFIKAIREAGFNGELIPGKSFYEGGKIIPGNEFWLISNYFSLDEMEALNLDLQIPVYRIIPLPADEGNMTHIDTLYALLDDARILYSRLPIAYPTENSGIPTSLQDKALMMIYTRNMITLTDIALESEYELRRYKDREDNQNGINLITGNGVVCTKGIAPEEKEYIQLKGVEVVEIPLKHTADNAGLRCVYGELVIPKIHVAKS